ncbi:MAG: RNA methyltransferase [Bacteroidales bacterium]|nr:RNA methyltransferase [Bacteroidales bacterium]
MLRKIKNEELGRISAEDFKRSEKLPVVIILDNIRSLNNIGSVFRTSDSFRVEALYLCGITGSPPHREIQKTALGATESVNWKYFEKVEDAVADLQVKKYQIVAIEQIEPHISLETFSPLSDQKYALIFGNEINGVSESVLGMVDFAIEIPQFGTKHSFNVAVSAGIVLWHFYFHNQGKSKNKEGC